MYQTTEMNGLPTKRKSSSSSSPMANYCLAVLTLLLLVSLLGISIATLVRVYSSSPSSSSSSASSDGQSPATTPAPTTSTSTSTSTTTTSSTTTTPSPPEPGPTPSPDPPDEELNIPSPELLSPDDDLNKFWAYSNYTARLRHSLNTAKSPCDNFYEYACGNHRDPLSFAELLDKNFELIGQQMENQQYLDQSQLPVPVKKAALFYRKCVEATSDWATEVGDGFRLRQKMDALATLLDVPFPALDDSQQLDEYPLPAVLARVLGYLGVKERLDTFVSSGVDNNWREPHGEMPFLLLFDQATLGLPMAYYTKLWDQIKDYYLDSLISQVATYAQFRGVTPNMTTVYDDCVAMRDLEYTIATQLNTQPNDRRTFAPQFNLYTVDQANAEFQHLLDFDALLGSSYRKPSEQADMKRVSKFVIKEPDALNATLEFLYSDEVLPRTIYNYLYTRLLGANIDYLPRPKEAEELPRIRHFFNFRHLGLPREDIFGGGAGFGGHHGKRIPELPLDERRLGSAQAVKRQCLWKNAWLFPYANGRLFLDARFPGQSERSELRQHLRLTIAGIVDAFKGMVAQLDWMDAQSKVAAYAKIDQLVTNVAWPDFIEDDQALTAYYGDVKLDEAMSYTQMVDELQLFAQNEQFKQLFEAKDTDRRDFGMGPSVVNAWYNPELNSITFPLAILGRPFYDPNYPASVNYGALGIVAGHELSHGFDDQGVQWDGTGQLRTWLSPDSETGFHQMAQCVVDEYGAFEPFPKLHIDGQMTQGENIADNGGLRAAYRAFRTHQGLYGPDPRLPDPLLKALTHEQLFFLGFAQCWCEVPPSEGQLQQQLLTDPHSPSKYRILGSLQNFPAFRAAFNCPLNADYAPAQHCQVWETDSRP